MAVGITSISVFIEIFKNLVCQHLIIRTRLLELGCAVLWHYHW